MPFSFHSKIVIRNSKIKIMDQAGNIYLHQNMPCNFETFLLRVQPYLPNLAVGVEAMHCYYWLFDNCQEAGIPFFLGHSYYMKTISISDLRF